MRILVGGVACLVVLVLAPIAEGAQRYASPTGSGTECAKEAPCSLKQSLEGAGTGDEVIVGSGSYVVSSAIAVAGSTDLNIHGDPAGPMPTIAGSVLGNVLSITGTGHRIAYLAISNTAASSAGVLACSSEWVVERVRFSVISPNSGGLGLAQEEGCLVRDSLILAEGPNSVALQSGGSGLNATARNVTAIARGSGSTGIAAFNASSHALDLKNSIASGEASDLLVRKGGFGSGKIFVSNSNFETAKVEEGGTIANLGGNQSAPPLFVNAPANDFREAVGSPTIDAGVVDQLGLSDLDGGGRALGAGPDIGAYEFTPAIAPPPSETQLLSLTVAPAVFRAASSGGAIASAKKGARGPMGATVGYVLSTAGGVAFSVERKAVGRRVGKKCVRQTKANAGKKRCSIYKPVGGGFTVSGTTGGNSFKFFGRIGSKRLKPGTYRLTGTAGTTSRSAGFRIVK